MCCLETTNTKPKLISLFFEALLLLPLVYVPHSHIPFPGGQQPHLYTWEGRDADTQNRIIFFCLSPHFSKRLPSYLDFNLQRLTVSPFRIQNSYIQPTKYISIQNSKIPYSTHKYTSIKNSGIPPPPQPTKVSLRRIQKQPFYNIL